MESTAVPQKVKQKGYITNSHLLVIALATAFFPRVLMIVKFPSAINFLHFAVVPLAFGTAILNSRSKNRRQIRISKQLLAALFIFLIVEFASALVNGAGVINVVLHFLLFMEPFMLLLAIVCVPMTTEVLGEFRKWILGFGFTNLIFALIQKFLLKWDTCFCSPGGWSDGDAIKGVFINQGSGHVVGGSVSLSLAAHFAITAKDQPLWLRALVVLAVFTHIIVSDTKQVILVAGVAFAILSIANVADIRKAILYIVGITVAVYIFIWAVGQFEFLSPYLTWARPDIYGPDGEATKFKLSGIRIISTHMTSIWNQLLGLGPGHTIDRLGGWMLNDYGDLLNPLGATRTNIANEVWGYMASSWLANGSSMFAPFFGWAAIWGDIGWLGLGAFLYVSSIVWQQLCPDDLSKFQMLTVFVNGLIFTQMQEPGYMLFIAALIGLRWQESQVRFE